MINLHNHSTWSDGRYPPELLAQKGVVSGLTHIGICDHFFTDKLFEVEAYVDADQLDDYIADLRRVADDFAEWIQVLAGIEVDWSPRARPEFPSLWSKVDQFDYVLFEYVQNSDLFGDSLELLLSVRSFIHIPIGLAHNDLSRNFAPHYTPEQLVALLEEHDIFVELSTAPRTMYYRDMDPYALRLWQTLADSRVRFSVGSDTHEAIDDVANVKTAHDFLQEWGLLDRLITEWWDPSRRMWTDR